MQRNQNVVKHVIISYTLNNSCKIVNNVTDIQYVGNIGSMAT